MANLSQTMPHWVEICHDDGTEVLRLGGLHHTIEGRANAKDLAGVRALHSNPQVDPCKLDQVNIALNAPGADQVNALAQHAREQTAVVEQRLLENTQRLAALAQEADGYNIGTLGQALSGRRDQAIGQVGLHTERLGECDDKARRRPREEVFRAAGFSQEEYDSMNQQRMDKEYYRIRRSRWEQLQTRATEEARALTADEGLVWNGMDGIAKVRDNRNRVLAQLEVATALQEHARNADTTKSQAKQIVADLGHLKNTGAERIAELERAKTAVRDRKEEKALEVLDLVRKLRKAEQEFKDYTVELWLCRLAEETLKQNMQTIDGKLAEAVAAETTATQVCEQWKASAVEGEARVKREVEAAARTCVTRAATTMTEVALNHQVAIKWLQMQREGTNTDHTNTLKQLNGLEEDRDALQARLDAPDEDADVDAVQDEVSVLTEDISLLTAAVADLNTRIEQQNAAYSAACASWEEILRLDGFSTNINKDQVSQHGAMYAEQSYKRFGSIPLNVQSRRRGPSSSFNPPCRASAGSVSAGAVQAWTNPDALQAMLKEAAKEAVKATQVHFLQQQQQQQQRDAALLRQMSLMEEQNRLLQEKLLQMEAERASSSRQQATVWRAPGRPGMTRIEASGPPTRTKGSSPSAPILPSAGAPEPPSPDCP